MVTQALLQVTSMVHPVVAQWTGCQAYKAMNSSGRHPLSGMGLAIAVHTDDGTGLVQEAFRAAALPNTTVYNGSDALNALRQLIDADLLVASVSGLSDVAALLGNSSAIFPCCLPAIHERSSKRQHVRPPFWLPHWHTVPCRGAVNLSRLCWPPRMQRRSRRQHGTGMRISLGGLEEDEEVQLPVPRECPDEHALPLSVASTSPGYEHACQFSCQDSKEPGCGVKDTGAHPLDPQRNRHFRGGHRRRATAAGARVVAGGSRGSEDL